MFYFFFTDPATTEIYTLSLHDALPISWRARGRDALDHQAHRHRPGAEQGHLARGGARSEEHTSELQSRGHLVCRLLLEKKKKKQNKKRTLSDTHNRQRNQEISSQMRLL